MFHDVTMYPANPSIRLDRSFRSCLTGSFSTSSIAIKKRYFAICHLADGKSCLGVRTYRYKSGEFFIQIFKV